MQVLIGSVTSNPCIAVAEQTYNDNMFQLTPSGTAVKCVQYDNAFRMCFSDPNQGLESAKYIGENGLATKVAVIYDSSDPYSVGIYEAFRAEAANQNIEIVSDAAFCICPSTIPRLLWYWQSAASRATLPCSLVWTEWTESCP